MSRSSGCNCGSGFRAIPTDTVSYVPEGQNDPIAHVQFRRRIVVDSGPVQKTYNPSEIIMLTYSNIRSIILGVPNAIHFLVPEQRISFLYDYPEFGTLPYEL